MGRFLNLFKRRGKNPGAVLGNSNSKRRRRLERVVLSSPSGGKAIISGGANVDMTFPSGTKVKSRRLPGSITSNSDGSLRLLIKPKKQ